MVKIVVIAGGVLLVIFILLILYLGLIPSTAQFKDENGNIIPESIAVLESVELGGIEQSILIRGRNKENPVLLWLHGGPGAAQMPLAHELDNELEKEFVLVHWDQRGAGKSNQSGFDETTMTFEQFLDDAFELVQYLRQRFKRDKIYLLGHSWGTQLGIELVARHPEMFYAYIGVSQLVDNRKGVEIAYDWLIEQITENEDKTSLNRLHEIGTPPYRHSDYREFADLILLYGGNFDVSMKQLVLIALRAPEYNYHDYIRWIRGANRGGKPMHREGQMQAVNVRETITLLEIPVYFFMGEKDYNTPLQLVQEYYTILDAPFKEIVTFENSAHTPFLGEPDKFTRELIRVKSETHTDHSAESNLM